MHLYQLRIKAAELNTTKFNLNRTRKGIFVAITCASFISSFVGLLSYYYSLLPSNYVTDVHIPMNVKNFIESHDTLINFSDTKEKKSYSQQFNQLIEKGYLMKLKYTLNGIGAEDYAAAQYVLAQSALMKNSYGNYVDKNTVTPEMAKIILNSAGSFSAKPSALYAIEKAAFGDVQTEHLVKYEEKFKSIGKTLRILFRLGISIIIILFIVAITCFLLILFISKRLRIVKNKIEIKMILINENTRQANFLQN